MKLFISGWAGFREALGDIPEDWHYINPFLDFDEEGILNFLEDKTGEILVAWSTGGHIVLKNIQFFSERFSNIIVIAGFKKFTNYVNPRIIEKMIEKMEIGPDTVVKKFLINAGCNAVIPKNLDYKKLIEGLKFLLFSDITDLYCKQCNLILIQGTEDRILPIKALDDLKLLYPFAKTIKIKSYHWITFEEILKIRVSDNI